MVKLLFTSLPPCLALQSAGAGGFKINLGGFVVKKIDLMPEDVAGRVRLARMLAGMTQTELARRVGLVRQSYVMRESGKVKFSVCEVGLIAHFLGVTPQYLAWGVK